MQNMVDEFINSCYELWETCEERFPEFKKRYWVWQKWIKQKKTNKFITKVFAEMDNIDDINNINYHQEKKFIQLLRQYSVDTLEYTYLENQIIFSRLFINVSKQFLEKSNNRYSDIDKEDIYQALRNVWIMASIQYLTGKEVKLTPSMFAYSMLYPYSDNYLDDNNKTIEEKKEFNKKFTRILSGENVRIKNGYEKEIISLVNMIESEYDRKKYPDIYNSLLAIHNAQNKSLLQQEKNLKKEKILKLSIRKGGTSVLAGALLVNSSISREKLYFLFVFGFMLQLLDDLQDIQIDKKCGHDTIFSKSNSTEYYCKMTNKLFNFMTEIKILLSSFSGNRASDFAGILTKSCKQLIFGAIVNNKDIYSNTYLDRLEKHSLFTFSYQKQLEKSVKKRFKNMTV